MDVGLLKEGDNAQFHLFSLPANIGQADIRARPIACSYYNIDAKEYKKLQHFLEFGQNWEKQLFQDRKTTPYWADLPDVSAICYSTGPSLLHGDDIAEACTIAPSRHLRRFI